MPINVSKARATKKKPAANKAATKKASTILKAMKQAPRVEEIDDPKGLVTKRQTLTKEGRKVVKRAIRRAVWRGTLTYSGGGLRRGGLKKNKRGKMASTLLSKQSSRRPWIFALGAARKALNVTGFCPLKKGGALYKKTKEIHEKIKYARDWS